MKRILLFLASSLVAAFCVHALVVEGYDPAVNDRFSTGYPNAPVPNASQKFIGKGLDWSGVGWWKKDPQYSVTLLSSRHFATTMHETPQNGDAITFLGNDGNLHDYHVARIQLVENGKNGDKPAYVDTALGTIVETVPFSDQVTHYPVVYSEKGIAPFIGRQILTYGHMARIATNKIVEGIMMQGIGSEYNFSTTGLTPGMGKSEVGDSGSPAFIVVGGKLALVGTHWMTDTDSMVPGVISSIDTLMRADGEKLEVVPLGE